MIIPPKLIEVLKDTAIQQGLGYGEVDVEGIFKVIIFANKTINPDMIALAIAHAMLDGILSGRWNETNEESINKDLINTPMKES